MQFVVLALSDSAGIVTLPVDAASESEARRRAESLGYRVVSIEARQQALPGLRRFFPGRAGFSLLLFCQHLVALLGAGLSLVEAMEALARQEPEGEAKAVLSGLLAALRGGYSLSVAMEGQSAHFPAYFVAMLKASEQTGGVAESLDRFVRYRQQLDGIRTKVRGALIYPTVLLAAGALVSVFLLGYVVPRFSQIYDGKVDDLPWLSVLLVRWGRVVIEHGVALSVAAGGSAAVLVWGLTRRATHAWLLEQAWRWPAIGARLKMYQMARFYRTMAMLLRGGMPVVRAIELAQGLLAAALSRQALAAASAIREGQSTLDAFGQAGLVTPIAEQMLLVGERAGNMDQMMDRIGSFYDDETGRALDTFVKLFEPAVMAFIGVVIGGIVVLMYLPIFDLAGSVQ